MRAMMNERRRVVSWGLVLALAGGHAARAASVNRFDNAVQLGGATLQLNGSGTRYRVMFKVYDLALYLPRKAATAEAVLDMAGPKRLAFIALRDLPGTDLGLAFIKGLQANNSGDAVQKHAASSTRLIEIFSGKAKLSSGDTPSCRAATPSPWTTCPAKELSSTSRASRRGHRWVMPNSSAWCCASGSAPKPWTRHCVTRCWASNPALRTDSERAGGLDSPGQAPACAQFARFSRM
jgi:hypothetical protein